MNTLARIEAASQTIINTNTSLLEIVPWYLLIASVILCLLWFETMFWSLELGRYTHYLKKIPKKHYRYGDKKVKSHHRSSDKALVSMTGIASIMAGIFSTCLIIIWLIFLVKSDAIHWPVRTFVFAGTFITTINFYVILARCADLPQRFWPLISQYISKFIFKKK